MPLSCYEPLAIHYKEKHTISVIKEAEGCSQITSNQCWCVFIKAFRIIHKANVTNKVEMHQHMLRLYLRTARIQTIFTFQSRLNTLLCPSHHSLGLTAFPQSEEECFFRTNFIITSKLWSWPEIKVIPNWKYFIEGLSESAVFYNNIRLSCRAVAGITEKPGEK